MKRLVRKALCVITGFIVIILSMFSYSVMAVSAQEPITFDEGVFIYDNYELIYADVKNQLNEKLKILADKGKINFYVLTVDNLNNKSLKEYATDIFSDLHLRKNEMLLVVSSNKEAQLVIGDNIEYLDETKCNQIIDKYANQKDYTSITENIVQDVYHVFETELNISDCSDDEFSTCFFFLMWLIFFVLALCVVIIKM